MKLYIEYKDFDSVAELSAYFRQSGLKIISIETLSFTGQFTIRAWFKN